MNPDGLNAVELGLFTSRLDAICDEMGAALRRSAFSPNIRDRLDYSCAIFDRKGELCAQAAHIPVHLGSMAWAMAGVVSTVEWADGDMVILNDPYLGGTHLPDVTLIAPLFSAGEPVAYLVNRAHHADIGAATPGSMPLSVSLDEEGLLIPPTHLLRGGVVVAECHDAIIRATGQPQISAGDLNAQISANRIGLARLAALVDDCGPDYWSMALDALADYAERMARSALAAIPYGNYRAEDWLDGDGIGSEPIPLRVEVRVAQAGIEVDFAGSAQQVRGNLNCPLQVTAAAVLYLFRCLMPAGTPASAGAFRPLSITAPAGSILNANRPAAVAAGNVETSSRVVDLLMAALAPAIPESIPAASQGTMNNLAIGGRGECNWDYYETIAGGMGAGPKGGGLSAVHTHMTNTLNTPIEVVEMNYPLRITRYQVRSGSGGHGYRRGGDGVIREYQFLAPATVTLLSERRDHPPPGLAGGEPGATGLNRLNERPLPAKVSLQVVAGDCLTIETPGGGGWGLFTERSPKVRQAPS